MINGSIFVLISIIVASVILIMYYFGALWHTRWLYKIQMKELDKRYWYHRMGLAETGCLTKHTRFLK